ncbi:hypothetical protein [Cryobacterium sp. Hb1]|uniref:hypothetical protein n=1 Tax=Cryobacterium sp. Hb1 TaxID=1259147 RepID=UPI00106C3732|nr:hypothetical protein [Cryobacterium sp. Hb1]TFD70092.1 hypothetical protein E3T38_06595 [Cryobacterium sp. Hb1]
MQGDPCHDAYRQPGGHIRNAAGVWSLADDLGHLNDYACISARSEHEVDVLRSFVPHAEVLPCATLLQSDHFDIKGIEPGEPVVEIPVVLCFLRLIEDLTPIIDAILHKKLFLPFPHYNGDQSFMRNLPFNREKSVVLDRLDPLPLHPVIRQMD